MPRTTCPGCNRIINVHFHQLASVLECTRCGTRFTPNDPESKPPPIRQAEVIDEPVTYDDYQPVQSPGTKIAVIAIAFMGLLAILIVLVVALNQPGQPEKQPAPQPQARQRDREAPVIEIPRVVIRDPVDPGHVALVIFIWCLAIAWVVGVILTLIFVAKDTKARGQDAGPMWLIVILFTGIVGLLVYLASRPPGSLVLCSHCHNKRLDYAKTCPYCGRE